MEDNSKTNLDNRPLYLILGILLGFTALAAIALSSLRTTAATDFSDDVSITVQSSCTLGGTVDTAHATNLQLDTFSGDDGIGQTTLTAFCNDYNGFSIYAIGYTGNTYGNTNLVGTNTSLTIPTGVYTTGDTTSKWAMKVNKVNDSTAYNPANMSITNSYDSWHVVPSSYAQVAEYHANTGASHTDATLGGKITTTYAAYSSAGQTADTYEGQVKYTIVHPYNAVAPTAAHTMQNVTGRDLAALMPTIGSSTTLVDERDGQNYTVAKLADGRYWMTTNLNIAGGTTLNCDTTDCDEDYVLPSDQGWQSAGQLPGSSTTGFNQDNYAYVYNSSNTADCGASGQDITCSSYYSWDAATLGSGRNITTENTDAPYSICPKGWRLPTSGQHDGATALTNWKRGDFYRLLTAYGANLEDAYDQNTTTFWTDAGAGTAANFLRSGGYNGSMFYNGGNVGYYWSSTSTSSTYSRGLSFSAGNVNSALNYGRRVGFNVRCIYADTMQDITTAHLSELTQNDTTTTTLRDIRDGQDYTVAKLADDKYWMTSNLNLAGGTALSSTDTDVSADYIANFTTSNNLTQSGHAIVLPASSTTGFDTDNYAYVYNSGNTPSNESCAEPGCFSYYSWDAATLGSGRSISTDNTDAPHSICPKGWKLPTSRTTSATNWQTTSDFYALAHQYGLDSTTSKSESDNGFYTQAGPGTALNFLLSGYYNGSTFNSGGIDGRYWSSTSSTSITAGSLYFYSSFVDSVSNVHRWYGFSVRCLLR